jgi:sigma-70-like protein
VSRSCGSAGLLADFAGELPAEKCSTRTIALGAVTSSNRIHSRISLVMKPSRTSGDECGDEFRLPGTTDSRAGHKSAFLQGERNRILSAAMNKLTPEMRTAIELRELGESSTRDVARVMGLSVGTVKGRVFQGRRKLPRVLKGGSAMSPLLKRESDRFFRKAKVMSSPVSPGADLGPTFPRARQPNPVPRHCPRRSHPETVKAQAGCGAAFRGTWFTEAAKREFRPGVLKVESHR